MTKITEIYNTLTEAKLAKARDRVIHAGDEPRSTNLRNDGRWEIIWALQDDADHSKNKGITPKRQLTQPQLLQEISDFLGVELI